MFVLVGVLIVGFLVATRVQTDEWAITPGLSRPVGPLISIGGRPSLERRTVYLTDVYLTQLSAWQLFVAWLHPVHEELINTSDVTGGDIPVSELDAQAYLQMYDSQDAAKLVALRALGLHVGERPAGARIYGVLTGSPAAAALSVGDAVTAADGRPVVDACGLVRALRGVRPGARVALTVVPATVSASGTFRFGRPKAVEVRAARVPSGQGSSACGSLTAWLGVQIEDAVDFDFPVRVSIDTADIGGPSAGLAMTLGIIDALSTRSITGHLKVAATGQIFPDGSVGDVGGVAEKTIAVERAGATVFFVPLQERKVALDAASSSLRVFAVSTLAQVLTDLRRLGGAAPSLLAGPALHHATS